MLESLKKLYAKIKYRNRYHEYYAKVMETRTNNDPQFAVGGHWEEIGKLQFDYMVKHGLQPSNKFLDFGCGSLRGGLHYIKYLDEENYDGLDISVNILEHAKKFLAAAGLENKRPSLHLVKDLSFDCVTGKRFDYIIAQSVLSHMPLKDIETSFANIKKVMHDKTLFFATFHDGGDKTFEKDFEDFYYPFETLQEAGKRQGLMVELMNDYPHPRKQKMMKIILAN